MMKVGDKVKINITVLDETGLQDCETQIKAYEYITEHPDEVYTVSRVDDPALANIILNHPIVGVTSFFEDELIKVGEST